MSGVDRVTRSRIELIVADADYRDAQSAVADAGHVALLAAIDGAAAAREAVRLAAVRAANATRGAGTVRTATTAQRVLFVLALVLGAVAVGLVAISPRTGGTALTLQSGILLAGVLAAVAAGVLWWLEPLRANGALWGSHVPAVLYLLYAVVWIGFAVSTVAFRWSEVDMSEPWGVIVGLLLFLGAGIAAVILWRRGRTADSGGSQTGIAHVTRDLVDQADAPLVFDALDRWWATAGPAAAADDRDRLVAARLAVLAYLKETMLIDDAARRRAAASASFGPWQERRR